MQHSLTTVKKVIQLIIAVAVLSACQSKKSFSPENDEVMVRETLKKIDTDVSDTSVYADDVVHMAQGARAITDKNELARVLKDQASYGETSMRHELLTINSYEDLVVVRGRVTGSYYPPDGTVGMPFETNNLMTFKRQGNGALKIWHVIFNRIDRGASNYTLMKMPDGKEWTNNINIDIPGSACYDSTQANCDRYGRLYNWKISMKVCGELGPGWRLPTGDDWKQLAKHYGGAFGDSDDNGKGAFVALMDGGSSKFNALLGGGMGINGESWRGDAHGFYWTSTELNDSTAAFINFGKGRPALYIQNDGEKSDALAVRCVKDN
ncbi:MAG TPA: FISUMP domain-containing protein [Cyclobacteriaceae bacterium]|nr:FISUMP domain-containing protein [Cyclobacteriaceae bacterium]